MTALGELGRHVGIAFQLVDDALDYRGDPACTGKLLLADLHEGKVTLPLLFAIDSRPELTPVLLRAREGDDRAAQTLLEAVVAERGTERARARAEGHTRAALAALATLPASGARDLLAALATELATRGA